jgi:hypothetical protein
MLESDPVLRFPILDDCKELIAFLGQLQTHQRSRCFLQIAEYGLEVLSAEGVAAAAPIGKKPVIRAKSDVEKPPKKALTERQPKCQVATAESAKTKGLEEAEQGDDSGLIFALDTLLGFD